MAGAPHTGKAIQPTGAITAITASALVYAKPCSYVIFSNANAALLYVKINDDPASPTVSTTNFDFVLSQNQFPMTIEDQVNIRSIGVFTTAAGASIGAINASAAGW